MLDIKKYPPLKNTVWNKFLLIPTLDMTRNRDSGLIVELKL